MNWKKGFRRIAFVSAIFIAFICAGLCVVLVLLIHSEAQSNLNWKKDSYSQNYETQQIAESSNLTEAEQQELAFLEAKKTQLQAATTISVPKGFVLHQEFWQFKQAKQEAEAEIKKLERGFLVNLSKSSLVGLCGVGGIVGGIIGFAIVWLIYKLLEWLVLGFCDNNRLQSEKT